MVEIVIGGSICGADAPVAAGVSIGYFNDIAQLRAQTAIFTLPVTVFVSGNQTANDGFGMLFTWDPASVLGDNGSTIINQTNNVGAGRWVANSLADEPTNAPAPRSGAAVLGDEINVSNWGAIGDGASHALNTVATFAGQDSSAWTLINWQFVLPAALALTDELDWAAWQSALDYAVSYSATVTAPRGTFLVNRTLNRPSGVSIRMGATCVILAAANLAAVITSPAGTLEYGAMVSGGTIDCNFQANIGIEVNYATAVWIVDVAVEGALVYAYKFGDTASPGFTSECHLVRAYTRWRTIPAGVQPSSLSSGLFLYNVSKSFFDQCTFSNHDVGVQLAGSTGNRFTSVRGYNISSINEMTTGFLIDSASPGNFFEACNADQCKNQGWEISAPFQFLGNCAVTKTYGTANNLTGIGDNAGSNTITGLLVLGTPSCPIQQSIAFLTTPIQTADKIFGVQQQNVNTPYTL